MSDESKTTGRSSGSPPGGIPPGGTKQSSISQSSELRSVIPGFGILPTEDRATFAEFREDILAELDPHGIQQELIADRIMILTWRLRHLGIFLAVQNARKEFAPLLRSTLTETLLAYNDALTESNRLYAEDVIKQKSMSSAEKWKFIREVAIRRRPEAAKEIEERYKRTEELDATDPDAFPKLLAEEIKALATPEQHKQVEKQVANGFAIELAFYGDVFTPENFFAELELSEAIERVIDKNRERLRKLKEETHKSSESSSRRSRILPPY